MTYYVHCVEQDLASKWYARVVISEKESTFIKFDEFPTMEAIQEKTKNFLESRQLNSVTGTNVTLVRARDEFGRFLPDDLTTPENEAWVEVTDAVTEQV